MEPPRAELGLHSFDPTQTYHMRGVPDEQISITVDCAEAASRVVAGMREHNSQLHVMSDDPANRSVGAVPGSGTRSRGPNPDPVRPC